VAKEALASGHRSYPGIKRALDLRTVAREAAAPQLKQSGDEIRQLSEYSAFFDHNTHHSPETDA